MTQERAGDIMDDVGFDAALAAVFDAVRLAIPSEDKEQGNASTGKEKKEKPATEGPLTT